MSKAWRVVIIIFLIALILGAVAFGVGVITGANYDRIYSVLDTKYNLDFYTDLDMWSDWLNTEFGIALP